MFIRQTVIAAGGLGTRLRPLTNAIPKVMIPLAGKPLLEHHVEQFKRHGVREFFFTIHYLPKVIMHHFGDGSRWGVKINYFLEKEPLGSGGGLKQFADQLDDHYFFIWGDTFSLVDYTKMQSVFFQHPGAIGMQRVVSTENYADDDVADVTADLLFEKIHPKPRAYQPLNPHRLRGVFIFHKKVFAYIPAGQVYDLNKQLLPELIRRGEKFYGYLCDDYSKGIDTMEKYREVEEYLRRSQID